MAASSCISAITRDNYREVLGPLLGEGGGQGFCVNLSVDTSSLEIMEFCREIGALYIDTVVEPWAGFYFDDRLGPEARSNYALRETRAGRPPPPARRGDCGLLLRRQSRHGVMVRQAGPGRPQARPRPRWRRAPRPPGLGRACRPPRHQGNPHCRARHPARPLSQAPRCVHQHLVGRGLHLRGPAAGRAWFRHPRKMDAGECEAPPERLRRGDLSDAAGGQHARPQLVSDTRSAIRLSGHP